MESTGSFSENVLYNAMEICLKLPRAKKFCQPTELSSVRIYVLYQGKGQLEQGF